MLIVALGLYTYLLLVVSEAGLGAWGFALVQAWGIGGVASGLEAFTSAAVWSFIIAAGLATIATLLIRVVLPGCGPASFSAETL